MLRDRVYKDIVITIDGHSRFDSTDFKIEYQKEQNSSAITLTIKYVIEPKYKIVFKIPSSTTSDKDSYGDYYAFSGKVCPGPLAYEETFSFKGEHVIYDKIKTWLNCIWEELSSNPIVKKVETHQDKINEIFEKLDTINDGYFTETEAEELKLKLDELEKNFKTQLEKNSADKKKLEGEIEKLHTDIDTLKETIGSFKKKGWLKSFTGKIFKWTTDAENRKLLKEGYSAIKILLPEDIKNSLP